ncbi:MAG: L,D-transpeptidase family protein [Acidimicrobiales bacterium]
MASMKSIRWGSVGTTLMLVATATGVYGITGSAHESQANASAIPSSPTAMATTTVATAVTTMTTTTTIPIPVPVVPVIALTADLAQGASGDEVLAVQNRLVELGFDPGKLDGSFGLAMRYAVEGFQKFQGLAATGVVNAEVVTALANGITVSPLVEDGAAKRLEIDLTRQVLILWEEGNVRLISTISTGSGRKYCVNGSCQVARTPTGDFEFMWRYSGWRESRLGKLYNPVYFTAGGIAVHGSGSVPTHPASHGCIRIPMHIASYFPSLVAKGDPVHVVGESPPGPGGGTEYITVKPPPAPEPEVVPVPATIDPTSPTPTTITTVAPSPAQAPASQVPALSTPTVITPQPVVVTAPPLP